MIFSKMFFVGLFACSAVSSVTATDYYVDDVNGSDANSGTSERLAWKTLERVNSAKLVGGDKVLFRRGGLWRGQLRPQSGEMNNRILYSTYGKGPKPILQNSIDRSKESDWVQEGENLWATKKVTPEVYEQIWSGTDCKNWRGTFQEGVKGRVERAAENGETFVRVTCTEKPKSQKHLIQLWGPEVKKADTRECMVLKMKVRSSIAFEFFGAALSRGSYPWTMSFNGNCSKSDSMIDKEWKTISIVLDKRNDLDVQNFHISIGDVLPKGAVFDFVPIGLWRVKVDYGVRLPVDVGIFICDHGEKWGVKKWKVEDLKKPLDYWFDQYDKRVFVNYPRNPAKDFKSIELALTKHTINQGGCSHVNYDGLTVRYTGAHGFGGGSTHYITIRNCDVYWIGGGLQFWKTRKDGTRYPVRFGNGIEFWEGAENHLVERCRLWQVYDAALTNQGPKGGKPERNIIWRDNVIWQAEYSFEYWNGYDSVTENIIFEHNTCIDAGGCWSHDQRPDVNGAHLMFYNNGAATTNFVVRNNLFIRTTDRSTRMFNVWDPKPLISNNLYWIPTNKIYQIHYHGGDRRKYPGIQDQCFTSGVEEFKRYQKTMNFDTDSYYGEVQFMNEAVRDYRIKPGTFGSNLATDGGPIGARNMPGLDKDQSVQF